jgi:pimeloyl-ACP methyl ester carboxylesterase
MLSESTSTTNTTLTAAELAPAEVIVALERSGARVTTPCAEGEVVWRVWGKGRPLVLLHGGTGSWMHWLRNVEDLAHDFMVVAPDIPGSGESGNPGEPITAERIGAMLASGLPTVIGPDTGFAIAGFSMGGLISGYVAQHCGARARCLVLVGSSGTDAPRPPMEELKSWRRLPTEAEKLAAHRKNLAILMFHDPNKIDALAIHMQAINAERSRVRGKHVSHTGSLVKCLPHFKGRLAGIWGEHDATAKHHLDERRDLLRRFQPEATFDVFDGVGHWVQYEAAERFNRRLRELVTPVL